MLIDCFPGFNELELAEFRIKYLSSYVDLVIIAESSLTHSGHDKKLHFSRWLESKPELKHRVLVLEVDLKAKSDSWEREIATREALISYATTLYPKAKFILSDLDELPSNEQVNSFLKLEGNFHFITPSTYRYANWHLMDEQSSWKLGVMGGSELARYPNGGRMTKFPTLDASDEGIHLSYLNHDSSKLELKLRSFAHQELNFPEMYSVATLDYADRHQIDHLGRFEKSGHGLLHQRSLKELSDVQLHALKFNSSWFNFVPLHFSDTERKFASLVLTTLTKNRKYARVIYSKFIQNSNIGFPSSFKLYSILIKTFFSSYSTLWKHSLKKHFFSKF